MLFVSSCGKKRLKAFVNPAYAAHLLKVKPTYAAGENKSKGIGTRRRTYVCITNMYGVGRLHVIIILVLCLMTKLTEVADSVTVKDGKGRTRPHSPCCFRLGVSNSSTAMVACHHRLTKLVANHRITGSKIFNGHGGMASQASASSSSKCVGSWRRLSRKLVKSFLPRTCFLGKLDI